MYRTGGVHGACKKQMTRLYMQIRRIQIADANRQTAKTDAADVNPDKRRTAEYRNMR